MPNWQRTYLIACCAVIGYTLAYALSVYGEWPKLTYFPYERSWEMVTTPPGPVPSNYVGIVLWGVGGATVGAAGAWLFSRLYRRELAPRWLHLFGGWALTGFVLAGAFFTWNLWPF